MKRLPIVRHIRYFRYYVASTPSPAQGQAPSIAEVAAEMERSWLEEDGRRLPMRSRQDGFSIQVALDGSDYAVGFFVMGSARPVGDRVTGISLLSDGDCKLLWRSGSGTCLGFMAPAVVEAANRSGRILFWWRDDHDQTIQRDLFPAAVD